MKRHSFLGAFLGAVLFVGSVASAEVWVVDVSGGGDFTQIQPAINAAADGDTILVASGGYNGFTVDQKSVWIVANGGAPVALFNTVEIKNLSAKQSVLLSGLIVNAHQTTIWPGPQSPALKLVNNVGHVRARGCNFNGADGLAQEYSELGNGGAGASIESCLSVAFESCTFLGGDGKSWCWDDGTTGACGAPYDRGGDGVMTTLSISAFYDCFLIGGNAGMTPYYGPSGNGGNGCDIPTFAIFASGSHFIGGNGGAAEDFVPAFGGNGGHGIRVAPGARTFLLDNEHTGGAGGWSPAGPDGVPGQGVTGGGIVNDLIGTKRLCSSEVIATSGGSLSVTFRGVAGDRVYLPTASTSHWQYVKLKLGVWLLPVPVRLDHVPLAVLPPSGVAVVSIPMPHLPPTETERRVFAQAMFLSAQGQFIVGSPLHFLVMN